MNNDFLVESWENALRVLQRMTTHQRLKHFEMNNWARKTSCGTVGCIAGHCVMDPWFQQNRDINVDWRKYPNGESIPVYVSDIGLERVFGRCYSNVFYDMLLDHEAAVRRVQLILAELKNTPVCPLGWGIPGPSNE